MSELGYGKGYLYSHNYPGNFVKQQFMPDELKDTHDIWSPHSNAPEAKLKDTMNRLWCDTHK